MLPSSIRRISLHVTAEQDDGTLKALFGELLVARHKRSPQLESFGFECEQWGAGLGLVFEKGGQEILHDQELPPKPPSVARAEADLTFDMKLREAKSASMDAVGRTEGKRCTLAESHRELYQHHYTSYRGVNSIFR